MAITESRAKQQGDGEPPVPGTGGSRRRHPWRRRILLGLGAFLVAAVVVLAILAGTYQPVQFGDAGGGSFAGLPAGTGLRAVNTFGGVTGETYVPPQLGVFTIGESIQNSGPEPVTIEAVSILSPQDQAFQTRGERPWPLTPAGSAAWTSDKYSLDQKPPFSGSSVAGLSLAPGQMIRVGIPVRMSGTCYDRDGWTGTDVFYVKERFLFFTQWVAVKFQSPYLLREPSYPGGEPAKDLICLSR
jgi:hypothetical protein